MASILSAANLWLDLAAVRERCPLVHCITNQVLIDFNANVLLAGAPPVVAATLRALRDAA